VVSDPDPRQRPHRPGQYASAISCGAVSLSSHGERAVEYRDECRSREAGVAPASRRTLAVRPLR
jgi:hypothetical protein